MPMQRVSRKSAISKSEFHRRLRDWLERTDEHIVGSPDVDERTAWIWIKDGDLFAKLHTDTRRAAVRDYLDLVRKHGDSLKWSVALSRKGKPSKIAFGPDAVVLDPFYLYLADSLVGRFSLGASG